MTIRLSYNLLWGNPLAGCILRKKKYFLKNKIFKRLIIFSQIKFTLQCLGANLGPKRLKLNYFYTLYVLTLCTQFYLKLPWFLFPQSLCCVVLLLCPHRFLGVRQALLRLLFLLGRHDFWEVHVKLSTGRYFWNKKSYLSHWKLRKNSPISQKILSEIMWYSKSCTDFKH